MSVAKELTLESRQRQRHEGDAYYTPAKPIRIILHRLRADLGRLDLHSDTALIVEPSAGVGSVVSELVTFGGLNPARIVACDIDSVALAKCKGSTGCHTRSGDYTQWLPHRQPALIVGNPPYKDDLPEAFVRHAFSCQYAEPREWMMAFLLRLNWIGSQGRADFHRAFPASVYVLPERPTFTGDGKTDSTEYAWFVWRSWDRDARIEVLPTHDPAQLTLC